MSLEPTGFLYPFIESDETDPAALLTDLAASASAKAAESGRLRDQTLSSLAGELGAVATEMAERFATGGRLFSFGNGGSSTDAALVAALFAEPPVGRPLPARSLVADEAILTALGNDVGFDLVFQRQLIAYARPGDIALGLSTSGNSENLLCAFAEARRRGMLTVGLAGHGGGHMSVSDQLDHCLVVRSDSVHRIQEAEDALLFELWERVQRRIEEPAAA